MEEILQEVFSYLTPTEMFIFLMSSLAIYATFAGVILYRYFSDKKTKKVSVFFMTMEK